MTGDGKTRRLVAEIRTDDPRAIAMVGARPLPHFWPMLSAYFRDVLLPPHRRAEDAVIAWTWHEVGEIRPISAAELAAVRKRLASDQQLLAENLETTGDSAPAAGITAGHSGLGDAMERVVSDLMARPDAELARFACRVEAGVRLHSWGAAEPAMPASADQRVTEVSGVVRIGGKPGRWIEVELVSERGETQARARTGREGTFRFSPVAPGNYRVQAASTGAPQVEAVAIAVAEKSILNLVLELERAPRRRGAWLALAGVAAAIIGGVFFWRTATMRETRTGAELRSESRAASNGNTPPPLATTAPRRETGPSSSVVRTPPTPRSQTAAPTSPAPRREEMVRTTANAAAVHASTQEVRPHLPGSPPGTGTTAGLPTARAEPFTPPGGAPSAEAAPTLKPEMPAGVAKEDERVAPAPETTTQRAERSVERSQGDMRAEILADRGEKLALETTPKSESLRDDSSPLEPDPEPGAVSERERRNGARSAAIAATRGLRGETREATAFSRVSRLGVAPWRLEFLGDAILPTHPVRTTERGSVTALRAEFLAAQRDALPRVLRERVVQIGVRFVVAAPTPLPARWQAPADFAKTIHGTTAEILLLGNPERSGPARLLTTDDRVVAELSYDPETREWSVGAATHVAMEWFFAVPVETADAARFTWRGVSGDPLPVGARSAEHRDGESRVFLARAPASTSRALAFFDRESGWGLVGGITETTRESDAR